MLYKTSLRLPHDVRIFPKPFAHVHNMNALGISVKLIFLTGSRQPINLSDPLQKRAILPPLAGKF